MQILNKEKQAKKSLKNQIWEGLGLHLGVVWDGLGPLWVALGRFLLVFLVFKIELFSSMGPRWAPRGLLDGFWIDFGKGWGDLDASWENLSFQS